mgnify:CR=1 FL=1
MKKISSNILFISISLSIHQKKFIEYRNHLNRIKRTTINTFYSELLTKYKTNIKKTWAVLNTITGRMNDKTSISEVFYIDNNLEKNPVKIADTFCEYFSEVGTKCAANIKLSQNNFMSYLGTNCNMK